MQVNFYNTGGWYYNSSWDTSVDAADHYYASKGRAWKMKITAVQMESSVVLPVPQSKTIKGQMGWR